MEAPAAAEARRSGRRPLRIVAWILTLLLGAWLMRAAAPGGIEDVGALRDWISSYGLLAPAVFVLIYAAALVLLAPAVPFVVLAALLFGPWGGSAANLVAGLLGMTVAFLLAHRVARETVERLVPEPVRERVRVFLDRFGTLAIVLLRLLPFPLGATSFALGLAPIGFRPYFVATLIGTVPNTVAYTWVFSRLGETVLREGFHPKDLTAPGVLLPLAAPVLLAVLAFGLHVAVDRRPR
jgi:uncharacterized membrane protein YdjX (TVP38/TMEM64 family)